MGRISKEEKEHWDGNTPRTAKFMFDLSKAPGTDEQNMLVNCAKELYAYIERYPSAPAVLSLIYEPDCIAYYFPYLQVSEKELDLAKKIIKSHVYAHVLSRCKDANILDRLEAHANPSVSITFNVLPSAVPQ